MSDRRRTLWGGLLVVLAAGLLDASIVAVQEGVPFPFALPGSLLQYAVLGLLATGVWRLCRWSLERPRPKALLVAAHLGAMLVTIAMWQSAYLGFGYLIAGPVALTPIREGGLWYFLGIVTTYGLMTAGILFVQTSRRLRDQKQREAELQVLAREAELRSLKAQFRPHFFFNVINSLYSLVETQPTQAKQMLDLVARLMRQSLEVADEDWVPLEWELESVRAYLEIERIRLGERLQVAVDVEESARAFPVPPLLLQPLVENAIKHGIAPHLEPGRIEVCAGQADDGIVLVVRDSGPGLGDGPGDGDADGHGLLITRSRLEKLYGSSDLLQLRDLKPRGFEAIVHLPAKPPAWSPG